MWPTVLRRLDEKENREMWAEARKGRGEFCFWGCKGPEKIFTLEETASGLKEVKTQEREG